jgi:methylated-DNA-[protein]-cysteine S-methyltransferase
VGTLRLWATAAGIRRIDFQSGPDLVSAGEEMSSEPPPSHLAHALGALREYFASERRSFDLPLDLNHATSFQRRIYKRLLEIPYGHVVTYGEVAVDLGLGSGAARAVGQAVGANPVVIVIPCHRVVGAEGRLSGFGGGLKRKARLLRLEGIEVDGTKASSKVHPEVLRLPL